MTEELVTFETAKLARKKGFDEICRNCWIDGDDGPIPINAPKDEELIGGFLAMFIKYKDDPTRFIEQLEKRIPKPLRNATLPDVMYSRPTQDLLEQWLREVHEKFIVTVPRGSGGYRYKIFFMNDPVWGEYGFNEITSASNPGADFFETPELAREAALQHALKLLPDA